MSKILIFGAGSIGTYLGAKLYAAGHEVTLYGHRKLRALHDPIVINQQSYRLPPRVYALPQAEYDIIFLTTKLYDAESAVQAIQQQGWNPKLIISIQNGLVDKNIFSPISQQSNFVVVGAFNGYHLQDNQISVIESEFGLQTKDSQAGRAVSSLLMSAGIRCFVTPDITQIKAYKLIINAALNALSALYQKTTGELIQEPFLRSKVDQLILESWTVLSKDYPLDPLEVIRDKVHDLARQVKSHYSSMYQDILSGRRTEIDFLNGLIVTLGHKKGIPTPMNCKICTEICAIEQSNQACKVLPLCS